MNRTNILGLKPGDRFQFHGDWQTMQGTWEVVEHGRDLPYMTLCRPITHPFEGESNFFSEGVEVVPEWPGQK